ncbi:polyprenol monophosphomannose synthase [Marisediminicola senii]|uniref:polyprenol monophosphomannose synthase n=1 Tax=Marisediminicola senii TaxID=2711233 RepID=UPI0013EC2A04|nr:polyprenol monophosphomannose synthase [Marisediminicola senii]
MPEVLVVIPTYDEIDALGSIVTRIRAALPGADVLVVDDSSPDGTGALADELASADPAISVLHRPAKSGLGAAYVAGFGSAIDLGYRFVVAIDADGSHDPAELPAMVALAENGADLVIGSRWVPGGSAVDWTLLRRLISRAGNTYSRLMLRSGVHDLTSGFRVASVVALQEIDVRAVASRGYCFQVEVAWRLDSGGASVVEHPITFRDRTVGSSKMRPGIVAEALWRITVWGVMSLLPAGDRAPRRPVRNAPRR